MSKWLRTRTMQFELLSLILGMCFLTVVIALSATTPVVAAPQQQGEKPSNDTCLACHQQQGMATQIGGQALPLTYRFSSPTGNCQQHARFFAGNVSHL